MANDIEIKKAELSTFISEKGLSEAIKPLTREIHLFDTYVAGTSRLKDFSVLDALKPGDKLTLQREDNKFDDNAIVILNEKKEKIGYIPEKDNIIFALPIALRPQA